MAKIGILTWAYNAECTLQRSIDSILGQSFADFEYYLCDNGSSDGTRDIIDKNAGGDKRIRPIYYDSNSTNTGIEMISSVVKGGTVNYIVNLDADDEYLPAFLEDMLAFASENNLDIAACGNYFVNAVDNTSLGQRVPNHNIVLDENHFAEYFPIYHSFMRAVWGKLYKSAALRDIVDGLENAPNYPAAYGGDTFFVFRALRNAKRIGLLAKTLHKYYVSHKSSSYTLHPDRVKCDQILHEDSIDFLESYGKLSARNLDFAYIVYFNAVKDTLSVVLNAQVSPLDKMRSLKDIFTHKYTQEMLRRGCIDNAELSAMLDAVLKWLLAQKECRRGEGVDIAVEILTSMYEDLSQLIAQDGLKCIISKMPEIIDFLLQKDYNQILERLRKWFKRHNADVPALTALEISACYALHKPNEEIYMLLLGIKKNRPQASNAIDIDAQIRKLIEKYPLLKNMSVDLASAFPHAIRWVMKENYKQALDAFISVQDVEINDDSAEAYILFGQNLSAAAENTDAYIYFKKVWISYLLDCSLSEEAKHELDEFEQLLPDDEEFIELRNRLTNG